MGKLYQYSLAVVMQNWNIIGPNVYVLTVALLCSMMQSNIFCLKIPCDCWNCGQVISQCVISLIFVSVLY